MWHQPDTSHSARIARSGSSKSLGATGARSTPQPGAPEIIAHLQGAVGNRAVSRLVRQAEPARLLQRVHEVSEADRKAYSDRANNPWPAEELVKLGAWSPTDEIFHGFAKGSASEWAKLIKVYPEAAQLLEYQQGNTRATVLKAGHVTYMGQSGLEWVKHTSKRDWSGLYLGESVAHAERYLTEGLDKKGDGRGSVWKVTLQKDLSVIETTGTFTSSGEVGEYAKAGVLKQVARSSFEGLKMDGKLWIKGLGEAEHGYYGDDADGVHELIVPWELVDSYLKVEPLYTYTIKGFSPSRDKA